jgi:hypothetical protein
LGGDQPYGNSVESCKLLDRSTPKLGGGASTTESKKTHTVASTAGNPYSSFKDAPAISSFRPTLSRPYAFNSVEYEAREQVIRKCQQLRKDESFKNLYRDLEPKSTRVHSNNEFVKPGPITVYQKSKNSRSNSRNNSHSNSPGLFRENRNAQNN